MDKLLKIINRTVAAIESSQNQIYEIAEEYRKQCKIIEQELSEAKAKAIRTIRIVESLEKQEKNSRYKLMITNKNFKKYNENDIKEAYEEAKELQLQLLLKKNEEQALIHRRSELETRLKAARDTLSKAEKLTSQIGVVLGYLSGDLQDVHIQLEDLKEKQHLGIKVIKAQEEERSRLSREIHDGPAQVLANIALKSELCERLLDVDKEKAREELISLKNTIRFSLKDVRKIIYDLRPMTLDDLGLTPTVEQCINLFSKETGIFIEYKVFGAIEKLVPTIELTVFRVIQEALTNVRKHSKASMASVRIEYLEDNIKLAVVDNGVGFNTEDYKGTNLNSGYGLLSMKERVELLNGRFEMMSKQGEGTKIYVTVPTSLY